MSKKLEEFKKWCEETTATFGESCAFDEDEYPEEYNISFNELVFYDELVDKVKELLEK